MKKILLSLLFIFSFVAVNAQDEENPIVLEPKVNPLGDGKYELIITANIDPDWCMYSQDLPEGGPYPTTISFAKSKHYELVGKAQEDSTHKKVVEDQIFNLELTKYYDTVLFKQIVKVKDASVKVIEADIDYMSCNTQTCLPPMQQTIEFKL